MTLVLLKWSSLLLKIGVLQHTITMEKMCWEKDLGYTGNIPNVWDGVPEDVLKDHDVSYDEEWIAKCVDQSKRNETAVWDEDGNLLT